MGGLGGWVGSFLKKGVANVAKKWKTQTVLGDSHFAPDEQDVEVDGGEDEEGDGDEEEKDVPGIEYKGDDDALLPHAADDEVKFEKNTI